jgi:hypothetical protein
VGRWSISTVALVAGAVIAVGVGLALADNGNGDESSAAPGERRAVSPALLDAPNRDCEVHPVSPGEQVRVAPPGESPPCLPRAGRFNEKCAPPPTPDEVGAQDETFVIPATDLPGTRCHPIPVDPAVVSGERGRSR